MIYTSIIKYTINRGKKKNLNLNIINNKVNDDHLLFIRIIMSAAS